MYIDHIFPRVNIIKNFDLDFNLRDCTTIW